MGGRPVPNEDLVNLPRCLALKLCIEDEDPIRLSNVELLSYRHTYDVRYALVGRELRFRDRAGRETSLRSRRFVSMGRMHLGALEWEIVAENWSGRVKVLSILDGRVLNRGVPRYHQLWGRHLDPEGPRTYGNDVIALKVRTRQSRIEIAEAARTRVYRGAQELDVARSIDQMQDYIQHSLDFEIEQDAAVRVEKMVSLYTSRDRAINEPMANAGKSVHRYPAFAEALEGHVHTWDELWEVCDVRLPRERRAQFLLRLHISHLLQVCSRLTPHHDAGVPARGLNGEAYRGHVFWDELYVYPFLNFRLPEITRGLLMYRYRRIGEARASAQQAGYRGAMYPWQSGSDGEEETQLIHINPSSGRWDPDFSHHQRHVNAAIFYNIWHYYQTTHDVDFLRDHGAEMMLEIARFWSSIAHFNPDRDRWEIHGVMGPDEFHENYPDADEGGLRNNAYTNVMVAWICETAQVVLDLLPKSRRDVLRVRIGLQEDEIERWQEISRKMFVPFHEDGIISQFEGYEDLEELDWDGYRSRYPNIQRLDRILRAEGDSPDRYSLSKQADTVMLFFLFSYAELRRLFEQLGYELTEETARRTIDFYERRTSHGSTLSFVTHAGVLARIDPESSWQRFLVALESDVGDVQGGTTPEGIHLGVMAGTLDLVQRAYLGTEIRDDVLTFDPVMIDRLDGLRLAMQFRRAHITVSLDGRRLTVTAPADGYRATIKVGVGDQVRELRGGDSVAFLVGGDAPAIERPTGRTRAQPRVRRCDLRHRRRARRFATRTGVAGDAARADGNELGPHSAADDLGAGAVHLARVSGGRGRQAPDQRCPGRSSVLRATRPQRTCRGVRRAQAANGGRPDRGGAVRSVPRCATTAPSGARRRNSCGRRFVVQEHRLDAEQGATGQIRRGARAGSRLHPDRSDRPRSHRRRHLWPVVQARQAPSRDLPHCSTRAGPFPADVLGRRGRRLRDRSRQGRWNGCPRHRPGGRFAAPERRWRRSGGHDARRG